MVASYQAYSTTDTRGTNTGTVGGAILVLLYDIWLGFLQHPFSCSAGPIFFSIFYRRHLSSLNEATYNALMMSVFVKIMKLLCQCEMQLYAITIISTQIY